jgi:hypothetical protein
MIQYRVRDRLNPLYNSKKKVLYVNVQRRGKKYMVAGVEVELFPPNVLAEAIDRKTYLVMRWERASLFPKPMYEVPGKMKRRWYSGEQVMNLHNLMHYRHGNYKSCKFSLPTFLEDVRRVFWKRNVVVQSNGEIKEV